MAEERLSMKKIKELLRLKWECHLSNRVIGRAVNISPSTVSYYTRAFKASGLEWPLNQNWNDKELIAQLEPYCRQLKLQTETKIKVNYLEIYNELKRTGVTLQLLWEEYKTKFDNKAYSYPEYCRRYRNWVKQLKPTLRQTYKAGEKCFIDYAGPKIPILDNGEMKEAVIFVGVLAASNYTFAKAYLTRSLPDWCNAHVSMFEFFGGLPLMVIPDNEKAGVKKACYYEPELNTQYGALANHYKITILPTRPFHPKDKAKVENAVLVVERWLMARLRNQTFFTLAELNEAIAKLLVLLNDKPFKKLPGCRKSHFEQYEKLVLRPLPKEPYEFVEIKQGTVGLDYHLEIKGHYYSVPYWLLKKRVEYRISRHTVEIFYQQERVASHERSFILGEQTTLPQHMPEGHWTHHTWTLDRFLNWAGTIGHSATQVAKWNMQHKSHPECCYRIHLGLQKLLKQYGMLKLEQACCYALRIGSPTYKSIRSILQQQLMSLPLPEQNYYKSKLHQNIRGSQYYRRPSC